MKHDFFNFYLILIDIAVKFAMKMVETTKSFLELNATYTNGHLDECKEHKFRSDKYWECYLRHVSFTMYHPVSTCKMGAGLKDKSSVVDSKLRYSILYEFFLLCY